MSGSRRAIPFVWWIPLSTRSIWNQTETALLPAPFWVHLRVEPAHFDWRWRERPALALLAWEALARDPLARLRRIQVESIGTTINFRPAASQHRALPIASGARRLAHGRTAEAIRRAWRSSKK